MSRKDDDTPVVDHPVIEIISEKIEHLCYVDPLVDTVRIWREGVADDCEMCRKRQEQKGGQ